MANNEQDGKQSEPSVTELERFRRDHVRELKRLERMSDEQFEAFKRNFELGRMDPTISRLEAMEVLRSMICTNLSLQQDQRGKTKIENAEDGCYPPRNERE